MSSLDTIVMDGGTSARWNQKNESNNSATDIVLLNVGGRWMATFRSTLTVVPTSGLANLFHRAAGGPKKTHFFFDYNPVLFEILLDQLRALKRRAPIAAYELEFVAPYAEVEPDFANMVSELGLSRRLNIDTSKEVHHCYSSRSIPVAARWYAPQCERQFTRGLERMLSWQIQHAIRCIGPHQSVQRQTTSRCLSVDDQQEKSHRGWCGQT